MVELEKLSIIGLLSRWLEKLLPMHIFLAVLSFPTQYRSKTSHPLFFCRSDVLQGTKWIPQVELEKLILETINPQQVCWLSCGFTG